MKSHLERGGFFYESLKKTFCWENVPNFQNLAPKNFVPCR